MASLSRYSELSEDQVLREITGLFEELWKRGKVIAVIMDEEGSHLVVLDKQEVT